VDEGTASDSEQSSEIESLERSPGEKRVRRGESPPTSSRHKQRWKKEWSLQHVVGLLMYLLRLSPPRRSYSVIGGKSGHMLLCQTVTKEF